MYKYLLTIKSFSLNIQPFKLFLIYLTINFISLFTLKALTYENNFLNKPKNNSGPVQKKLLIVDQKINLKLTQIYSEDFLKLPAVKKIKDKSNYGKTDPFQLNQLDAIDFNLSLIKLLGVILPIMKSTE